MKKTRYRRTRAQHALDELLNEVRALRAEVACLRANQVQIVPYPYPVYPQPQPINPWRPTWTWTSGTTIPLTNLQGTLSSVAAGGWDGSTTITVGD